MSDFLSKAQKVIENKVSITENGAIGYKTSGNQLLDLNFAVSSLRKTPDMSIKSQFMKAFYENQMLAMKWLFYLRDIRGGLGERRTFRVILQALADEYPEYIKSLLELVPEYGRWDDLWCLLDNKNVSEDILKLVKSQFVKDICSMNKKESISLLAKWLPSANASSKQSRLNAKKIYSYLGKSGVFVGLSKREYTKMLSEMRKYLDVVERKMSSQQWGDIKYQTVPSRANLIYGGAFLKHDYDRRVDFLKQVSSGEQKINAGTLYPCDIVAKYSITRVDETLENLWKALPNTVDNQENTIVVADGSGSMTINIGKNSCLSALNVAHSLAIYFAERSSGGFKDKYITFSENPQIVDLSECRTLKDKLRKARYYSEVANTNIEAVFDLILNTAIQNNMTQEELPKNILIISDMEFDRCARCNSGIVQDKLFDVISNKYAEHGYKLPRLVFWNVCSRTNTIPVKNNALGVALVSGFSTNTFKMVMSNQTDPYECLLEVLGSDRYSVIENRLNTAGIK